MKSQPKSRHVGAGVVTRYRNGACTFTCRHSGCRAYSEPRGWRAGLRQARQHAADHDAAETRYVGTPWGIPAHELPRHTQRRRPLRRLAAAMLILALAAVALSLTVANVNSHAAPAPGPTTTQAPYEYIPVPAGPPSSSAGGDR